MFVCLLCSKSYYLDPYMKKSVLIVVFLHGQINKLCTSFLLRSSGHGLCM